MRRELREEKKRVIDWSIEARLHDNNSNILEVKYTNKLDKEVSMLP